MLWEDKVAAWREDPVTKAFFLDISNDIENLTMTLISTEEKDMMLRLQGMLRALQGVVDMPEDGIENPYDEGVQDATS